MAKTTDEQMGAGVGFERIRRITGYLTGTVDSWNNAKQAELKDRVKHSVGGVINEADKELSCE